MDARLIKTSFYSDPKVEQLSKNARWLFMYFLTNQYIGLTGAFEISIKRTVMETQLTEKEIGAASRELSGLGFVGFWSTWIVVKNTDKHNNYKNGQKTGIAYEKEFQKLPLEVQSILNGEYPIDTQSEDVDRVGIPTETRNKKTEIRNIGVESVREGGKRSSLEDLTADDLSEIAEFYQVPRSFVDSKLDDMANWCTSKGKTYRDYKAALKNWVKTDALKITKEAHGQSKIAYINTDDTGGVNYPLPNQEDQRGGLSDTETHSGQYLEGTGGGG